MKVFGRSILIVLSCLLLTPLIHADVLSDIEQELKSGKHKGVTGAILMVGDNVLLETSSSGKSVNKKVDIRSATKSITSLLIGKLIEEGKLKSVKTKVATILPDEFAFLPKDSSKRKITIEDILTMRTGLACNDWVPASLGQEDKMYRTDDWARFILEMPMAYEVGEHFSYCTGGVVLLGRVIAKLSGLTVPEYADKILFSPLGIENAKWEQTPKGYTDTGGHLRLSLHDLHKIGRMMLANGVFEGTQVINKKWIVKSTKEHTRIYERREQYGYLWWRNQAEVNGQQLTLIYAHGNGGNFIFIIPELELVAAFTGTNFGKREQFIPLQLLSQRIVPALIKK
jgi:CubicO group peptidase (beta-lactamase class C family)